MARKSHLSHLRLFRFVPPNDLLIFDDIVFFLSGDHDRLAQPEPSSPEEARQAGKAPEGAHDAGKAVGSGVEPACRADEAVETCASVLCGKYGADKARRVDEARWQASVDARQGADSTAPSARETVKADDEARY